MKNETVYLPHKIKTGELTNESAERKLPYFDPLPDADNADVGSYMYRFLQGYPKGYPYFCVGDEVNGQRAIS